MVDHLELYLLEQARFLQLVSHKPRSERCRIKRHAQFLCEIGHGADMVLMRMSQHYANEVLLALLDEFQIGEDQLGAGILVGAKGHAQIDHQPLAVSPIEVDVHPDLARSPERAEQQFLAGFHLAFSARMAMPSRVRSASTASKMSVCWSNRMARPPVAMTRAGRPISLRIRAINPSIMAT